MINYYDFENLKRFFFFNFTSSNSFSDFLSLLLPILFQFFHSFFQFFLSILLLLFFLLLSLSPIILSSFTSCISFHISLSFLPFSHFYFFYFYFFFHFHFSCSFSFIFYFFSFLLFLFPSFSSCISFSFISTLLLHHHHFRNNLYDLTYSNPKFTKERKRQTWIEIKKHNSPPSFFPTRIKIQAVLFLPRNLFPAQFCFTWDCQLVQVGET